MKRRVWRAPGGLVDIIFQVPAMGALRVRLKPDIGVTLDQRRSDAKEVEAYGIG